MQANELAKKKQIINKLFNKCLSILQSHFFLFYVKTNENKNVHLKLLTLPI